MVSVPDKRPGESYQAGHSLVIIISPRHSQVACPSIVMISVDKMIKDERQGFLIICNGPFRGIANVFSNMVKTESLKMPVLRQAKSHPPLILVYNDPDCVYSGGDGSGTQAKEHLALLGPH